MDMISAVSLLAAATDSGLMQFTMRELDDASVVIADTEPAGLETARRRKLTRSVSLIDCWKAKGWV